MSGNLCSPGILYLLGRTWHSCSYRRTRQEGGIGRGPSFVLPVLEPSAASVQRDLLQASPGLKQSPREGVLQAGAESELSHRPERLPPVPGCDLSVLSILFPNHLPLPLQQNPGGFLSGEHCASVSGAGPELRERPEVSVAGCAAFLGGKQMVKVK